MVFKDFVLKSKNASTSPQVPNVLSCFLANRFINVYFSRFCISSEAQVDTSLLVWFFFTCQRAIVPAPLVGKTVLRSITLTPCRFARLRFLATNSTPVTVSGLMTLFNPTWVLVVCGLWTGGPFIRSCRLYEHRVVRSVPSSSLSQLPGPEWHSPTAPLTSGMCLSSFYLSQLYLSFYSFFSQRTSFSFRWWFSHLISSFQFYRFLLVTFFRILWVYLSLSLCFLM